MDKSDRDLDINFRRSPTRLPTVKENNEENAEGGDDKEEVQGSDENDTLMHN